VVCSVADFACVHAGADGAVLAGAAAGSGGDPPTLRGPPQPRAEAWRSGRVESVRSRYRQTSVGAMLASACREVMQVDVAAINGGSIKGNRVYESGKISYLELQQELPFPTKMIATVMPGSVLQDAVSHSRRGLPTDERRGYLQLDGGVSIDESPASDHTITHIGGVPFDPSREYSVTMPRNLFKGIFDIRPLVEFARERPEALGDDDSFIPAFNLVITHQAKRIWRNLGAFEAIDLNGDGILQRDEIEIALRNWLGGAEPSKIMVDNVINAIDSDSDGTLSREEYEQRLAAPLRVRGRPAGGRGEGAR
jgi:5'-nucleotidase